MYDGPSRSCAIGGAERAVLLGAVLLTACGAGGFPTPPRDASAVRIAAPSDIITITPSASWDYYTAQVTQLVFEGLTRIEEDEELVPGLARSWSASREGREFRFILRAGVMFHDGTPFTAADVRRCWTAALRADPDALSHPWMLDPIEGALEFSRGARDDVPGVVLVDDTTLVVRLREPVAFFPTLTSLPQTAISAMASDSSHPIGTGPWRWVSTGGAGSDDIRLARNARYWGTPPHLDSLVYRFVPDSLVNQAFAAGFVDMVSELPVLTRLDWSARSDVGFVESPAAALTRIVINMREPVFHDVRVRRALNHAIDVARLAQTTAAPTAVRAAGSIAPTLPGSDPEREPYAFDPALSRRLWQEGGYPADRPIRLWAPGPGLADYPPEIGELVRSYLEGAGFKVDLTVEREDLEHALRDRKADLVISVWVGDYPDGDAWLYPLYHSTVAGSAGNEGAYANPAADRLIDAARRALDPARRAALLRAADSLVFADAAVVPLWFTQSATVYSLRLAGWGRDPQNSRFTTLRVAPAGRP
jgi:peptide/nickel transport system substrate-binding protein